MKESFEKSIKWIIDIEGGYVNNPNDLGGETKFGISKRYYPNLDIKNLTLDQVSKIYKENYWNVCNCDELPYPLDIVVFDTAVNMGNSTAKAILKQTNDVDEYLWNRLSRYVRISKNNNQIKFLIGWINRILSLRTMIKTK